MASITAKKNQAKLAESIYKQTHCKCIQVYNKPYDLIKQLEYLYLQLYRLTAWSRKRIQAPTNNTGSLSLTVTKTEVENLLTIFRERENQKEKLDRTKFRDILHNTFGMTDDFLMDGGMVFIHPNLRFMVFNIFWHSILQTYLNIFYLPLWCSIQSFWQGQWQQYQHGRVDIGTISFFERNNGRENAL
jgi:hypothetical protein